MPLTPSSATASEAAPTGGSPGRDGDGGDGGGGAARAGAATDEDDGGAVAAEQLKDAVLSLAGVPNSDDVVSTFFGLDDPQQDPRWAETVSRARRLAKQADARRHGAFVSRGGVLVALPGALAATRGGFRGMCGASASSDFLRHGRCVVCPARTPPTTPEPAL